MIHCVEERSLGDWRGSFAGLGSASGVGKCYDDFGIIWLDAHGDINTSETSPSGNIHGMPLSALMGMGSEELVNVYAPGNKVNPQNVFLGRDPQSG